MAIRVRTAASGDVPRLLELYAELQPQDPPIEESAALDTFERAARQGCTYFVAEDGGLIVGTCYVAIIPNITKQCSPIGFLENVVVAAPYRRRGVGRRLMDAAIAHARACGCYKITLQSNVKRDGAHRFYEAVGFDGETKRTFEIRF